MVIRKRARKLAWQPRPSANELAPSALTVADNCQQRAFVVGAETTYDPAIHDLSKTSCELYIDGEF